MPRLPSRYERERNLGTPSPPKMGKISPEKFTPPSVDDLLEQLETMEDDPFEQFQKMEENLEPVDLFRFPGINYKVQGR